MGDRRDRRKIICGACGERVPEEKVRDAYRTTGGTGSCASGITPSPRVR